MVEPTALTEETAPAPDKTGIPEAPKPEPAPKPQPKPQPEPKPAPRPEPKSDSKAETKRESQSKPERAASQKRSSARSESTSSKPGTPKTANAPEGSSSHTAARGNGRGSNGESDSSQDGVPFDNAEYLANVQKEIRRHFRPPSNAKADLSIRFTIHRNGAVNGLEFVRRSGNALLDMAGMSAIEEAAGRGRFGPLPTDYPESRLTIVFDFLAANQ